MLSNFDIYGWPSKSDIFWAMVVANSRSWTVSWSSPEIREFATAIAQNISDLEGQPWKSKLLRMPFLVRIGSLTIFISLELVSSTIFLTLFGKTVNLNFNRLTGVNSICSIYFYKMPKTSSTKFIWELSNFLILLKNYILSNFDFHGWPSKSDIIWVKAVANSRICTVSSGYPKFVN